MVATAGFPDDLTALCRHLERELVNYFVLHRGFTQSTLSEWLAVAATVAALATAGPGLLKPTGLFLAERAKSVLYLCIFGTLAVTAWAFFLLRIDRWSFRGWTRYPSPSDSCLGLRFRFERPSAFGTEFRVRFLASSVKSPTKEIVWCSDLRRFFANDGRFLSKDFIFELERAISGLFETRPMELVDSTSK